VIVGLAGFVIELLLECHGGEGECEVEGLV
jgi:hypothetical protein